MSKAIVEVAGVDHSRCRTGSDPLLFSFFLSFFFFFFFFWSGLFLLFWVIPWDLGVLKNLRLVDNCPISKDRRPQKQTKTTTKKKK